MASPSWSSGEHCSASFCYPAHRPLHQSCWLCFIRELPGLVAAPPGVRAGSSPLVRSRLRALCTTGLFVAYACLSCLALGCSLQLGSWAFFQMPLVFLHTITSMASGLNPKPCPGFGSLPKPYSCYLSNHLGEKQLTSVSSCSFSTISVVVVDVSGDSTAMCSVNFDLRTRFFRVGFAATCPAAAWFSGLDVSP